MHISFETNDLSELDTKVLIDMLFSLSESLEPDKAPPKPLVVSTGSGSEEMDTGILLTEEVAAPTTEPHGVGLAPPVTSYTAPARPTTTESVEVALDKDNIPWDERIHSSSHKLTSKGVWARRRNVPESVFQCVMAELKGLVGTLDTGPERDAAEVVSIPCTVVTPPAPAPVVIPDNFPEMMQFIAASGLSAEQVDEACKSIGLDNILFLHQNLDKFPQLHAVILAA